MAQGFQLGVDVGGTFTDVYVLSPQGKSIRAKVPTTIADQSIGIQNGIQKARELLKADLDWLGKFQFIHHGTTTATNAVLEGKGARTALVVTAGHKDTLAVRRFQIPGGLGAWSHWTPPEPIVPLERVMQCKERMSVHGESVAKVDVEALRKGMQFLKDAPEAVAISLLNSYNNDAHERGVEKIVREELGPEVHLASLAEKLAPQSDTIRVVKSDGGLKSLALAGELPVTILMSAPAGSASGVADVVARNTPYKNLTTLDMSGTSTDCALIHNGQPQLRRETTIDNLSVKPPAVDIHNVEAGGGSIAAYMELTETLRVGPASAEASPGPACYGNGGLQPTVTDANLAAIASANSIAVQMNLPVSQVAEDIIALMNETIYGAVRMVSVEQGYTIAMIIPPSPGILCAQDDVTTKMRHEESSTFIRLFSNVTVESVRDQYSILIKDGMKTLERTTDTSWSISWESQYQPDLRYKGQALTITVDLEEEDLALDTQCFSDMLRVKFDRYHQQLFIYCLPDFELEIIRLGVILVDDSPVVDIAQVEKSNSAEPPAGAKIAEHTITVQVRVNGPCIITEMDSNTLILLGYYGEIDSIGNILINALPKDLDEICRATQTASKIIKNTLLLPTLIASALGSIRGEMDKMVLRCSMSPTIREHQDKFNVITNSKGQMLVGRRRLVTNDVCQVQGAISHVNDMIVLLPIFYDHELIGWASRFGHLADVGGIVPGSMSMNAASVFDGGVQIPCLKLYNRGVMISDRVEVLSRNSPAFHELLQRNHFVDDDGHGVGPWALSCSMKKIDSNRLRFDWNGTSPQSDCGINFYLSEPKFHMFIGFYLIAAAAPGTVINDGFHDLIDVHTPEGTVLKPVRPAPISCRTHFLRRTLDIIQALIGQKNDAYQAAAGFSDSPHFFYSGFKPNGEWFQLYQIGFGGVPARQAGDGPDCHCLFPAIKSIPTESIELNYPLRIEANESVADSGGPGFFRGGNAQRTLYQFLCCGEISLHDDRWFTKPWGMKGGKPGQRSRKVLYRYSKSAENPPLETSPSKCDHIRVDVDDLLEWVTWGGGGLGDPLTRPAEKVALEVHRKLVTADDARKGYGVVVNSDFTVNQTLTEELRARMHQERAQLGEISVYDRGGSIDELGKSCLAETSLPPPGYVRDWYARMREQKGWKLE
ncbi:Hydantoinase B/oxoprolinase family protein [Penicillium ucsense]|uniref:Hydantoinase B/oxoprolinase family protein n=1 Tax=Penicillium ucsense TaxID=2839758 RepID=A0A8J8WJ34_9EURO|nr:Hydantoinase B/oxoprolinase family protein [Penicillium ucsense]KAF7737521.1 Hydantoinase B/oxoprolinase family protein [Penicillium ucsense]